MQMKGKKLLLAVFLASVIPVIVLLKIPMPHRNAPTQTPDQSGATQIPPPSEGEIAVLMQDGSVVWQALEEYVLCVVLQEMPASFETEALKAQAVAARTYALRGDNHKEASVCTDYTCCQAYRKPEDFTGNAEDLAKIKSAVEETVGQVLLYNGALIDAVYFSCSGGYTEDAAAVWGTDIPYLQSVPSPGEENAEYYTDTVRFTANEFSNLFGGLGGYPATWIGNISYTAGGGVATIWIGGAEYSGTRVRELLGLRSTVFRITAVGDTVTVTTKGYGHRVGMSQYGADAMAVKGATYAQILAHYYPGTVLARTD